MRLWTRFSIFFFIIVAVLLFGGCGYDENLLPDGFGQNGDWENRELAPPSRSRLSEMYIEGILVGIEEENVTCSLEGDGDFSSLVVDLDTNHPFVPYDQDDIPCAPLIDRPDEWEVNCKILVILPSVSYYEKRKYVLDKPPWDEEDEVIGSFELKYEASGAFWCVLSFDILYAELTYVVPSD